MPQSFHHILSFTGNPLSSPEFGKVPLVSPANSITYTDVDSMNGYPFNNDYPISTSQESFATGWFTTTAGASYMDGSLPMRTSPNIGYPQQQQQPPPSSQSGPPSPWQMGISQPPTPGWQQPAALASQLAAPPPLARDRKSPSLADGMPPGGPSPYQDSSPYGEDPLGAYPPSPPHPGAFDSSSAASSTTAATADPPRKRGRPPKPRPEEPAVKAPRKPPRQPHNMVERKYREGLNKDLENLRRAIPNLDAVAGQGQGNKASKAMVLQSAVEQIEVLRREKELLERNLLEAESALGDAERQKGSLRKRLSQLEEENESLRKQYARGKPGR